MAFDPRYVKLVNLDERIRCEMLGLDDESRVPLIHLQSKVRAEMKRYKIVYVPRGEKGKSESC